MSIDVPADRVEQLSFRIKKFDYNRYFIDHSSIKGVLNLGNIVNNVGKVPDNMIPSEQMPPEGMTVGIGYQPIVSFTNQGEKHAPTELPSGSELATKGKSELTNYIVNEENYEPWNEYVLSTSPPKLLKTRTILTKVEWIIDVYNSLGDPYLLVSHNTNHSISDVDAPESGMR